MLNIIVKGGVVVAIQSASPDLAGRAVRIFDLDVEGRDPSELTSVMIDGRLQDALVVDAEVGPGVTILPGQGPGSAKPPI